jgi:hypothetical protein
MKLKDCGCGCTAQVTYKINDHQAFSIGCTVCDNKTPVCETLSVAILLWNQLYYHALPPFEAEPA